MAGWLQSVEGGQRRVKLRPCLPTLSISFTLHNQTQQTLRHRYRQPLTPSTEAQAPEYRFSQHISNRIAGLSPAFQALCFNEQLVDHVVELLAQVGVWRNMWCAINDKDSDKSYPFLDTESIEANWQNAMNCSILLQDPELPIRDRLIVMALKAYCAVMDDSDRGCMNLAQLQGDTGMLFPSPSLCFEPVTRDAHWLTWVAMLFLASSHTDALTWSLGIHLLDQQKRNRDWMDRLNICWDYLWEPEFSEKVMEKLLYLCKQPSITGAKFSYFST